MDPVVRLLWDGLQRLVAAVMLLLLAPVILTIAAWIRIADGKGVLFVQERAGRQGRPFPMWKFRSMVHDSVAMSAQLGISDPFGLVENDPRITRCGRFLRRTSLDELPQLVNVVRGQMNLVGPRPDVLPQVAGYSAEDARRLEVKPGITGWAQVNGRDDIDWPQRFILDRWYVDNWSPALDLKILWKTAVTLQRGEPPVHVDQLNIERAQPASTPSVPAQSVPAQSVPAQSGPAQAAPAHAVPSQHARAASESDVSLSDKTDQDMSRAA